MFVTLALLFGDIWTHVYSTVPDQQKLTSNGYVQIYIYPINYTCQERIKESMNEKRTYSDF